VTDRPTTLSVKELTTPSVKNNSYTLGMVGQYTSVETFVEVYRLRLSVFTRWNTLALRWCANTETEKTETEYLRLKTEPNQTEIEKSKATQPYF